MFTMCLKKFMTCLVLVLCLFANFKLRVGLEFPTTEVRFEHLNVEAEAYVGGRALPSVFNFSINMLEVIHLLNQTNMYK